MAGPRRGSTPAPAGTPAPTARRPTADTARRALAEGIPACPQCRPDTALGTLE
ncbi:DUF6233 domain-containing protein [Streptomyces sp. NPDC058157]|uniref:DUF6233 domain-containing protein n=1 Tax=Streptomyces sp. NPDC058157 TaxID=3346360 RepID=UPI0036E73141